jgi:hypothetical protein
VARLCAEALPRGAAAQAAVYGAALGGGRYARCLNAEGSVIAAAARRPASELTRADARSYAGLLAGENPAFARGMTAPMKAAGFTTMEFLGLVSRGSFLVSLQYASCVPSPATPTERADLITRAVHGRRPDRAQEDAERRRAAAHDGVAQ